MKSFGRRSRKGKSCGQHVCSEKGKAKFSEISEEKGGGMKQPAQKKLSNVLSLPSTSFPGYGSVMYKLLSKHFKFTLSHKL